MRDLFTTYGWTREKFLYRCTAALRQIAYPLFPLERSGERNATPSMAATYYPTFHLLCRLRHRASRLNNSL